MRKLLLLASTLSLVLSTIALRAQDNEVILSLRTGHNATFGGFAATSVEMFNAPGRNFMISSGIQYSTFGKTAVEARPAYSMDYSWGRLSAEALLTYTNLSSTNNFTTGAGMQVKSKWTEARLGYYYRIYGGRGGIITEPFNLYYELLVNLIPSVDKWGLQLRVTNCETFELERHYQPSYMAQCRYYPRKNLGTYLSLGYKPSGTFHISADYYQAFLKLGVSYRW